MALTVAARHRNLQVIYRETLFGELAAESLSVFTSVERSDFGRRHVYIDARVFLPNL